MRRPGSLSHRHAAMAAGVMAISSLLATATGAAATIQPGSYVTKTASITVAAGGNGAATAMCPSGDFVVTGGMYWHPTSSDISDPSLYTTLRSSGPKPDLSGWYATGANNTGQGLTMTAVAQCLPKSSLGKYTLLTRDVVVDPGFPGNANLRCKSGQQVLTGGAAWHRPGEKPKPGLAGYITSSSPFGKTSWLTVGRNGGSGTSLNMRVTALCVPVAILGSGYGFINFSSIGVLHTGDTVEHYTPCPAGKHMVAGGANWGYAGGGADSDTGDTIESSSITADGSAWYASGRKSDAREFDRPLYLTVSGYCI